MNDEEFEQLERQLTSLRLPIASPKLRQVVLADAHRELRAANWDRSLVRAAGALLLAGVGMNLMLSFGPTSTMQSTLVGSQSAESLAQVAVTVAETTDAQTGRRFALHLAAFAGWSLTSEQAAAIDSAVRLPKSIDVHQRKDG